MPTPCNAWGSKRLIKVYVEYAATVPNSEVGALIKTRVETGDYDVQEVETEVREARGRGKGRSKRRRTKRKPEMSEGARRKARKRYIDNRARYLWKKSDLKRAGLVLDGERKTACPIPHAILEQHFTELFSAKDGQVDLSKNGVSLLYGDILA